MIYTSGTNRILTINEADNTKVGWAADNTTSNGKLVFSDADVNWAGNSKSVSVSGTTTSLNKGINCSQVSYGGPIISFPDEEAFSDKAMSFDDLDQYIWTTNAMTFVCGDGSGDGDFYRRTGTISEPLYTKITFGGVIPAVDGKGIPTIRIYNNSNVIEFHSIRNGVISNYAWDTINLPACTNSITPPGASITPGCAYSPSPILSVNNGALPNSSLISTTFSRSTYLVICYAGLRYNAAYTGISIINKTFRTFYVNVSENGYISGLGSSYIDVYTPDLSPNYMIGWIGFIDRGLYKTYTYRGYGNLSVTRSTGYAGTATVTANETGSASITQTS